MIESHRSKGVDLIFRVTHEENTRVYIYQNERLRLFLPAGFRTPDDIDVVGADALQDTSVVPVFDDFPSDQLKVVILFYQKRELFPGIVCV